MFMCKKNTLYSFLSIWEIVGIKMSPKVLHILKLIKCDKNNINLAEKALFSKFHPLPDIKLYHKTSETNYIVVSTNSQGGGGWVLAITQKNCELQWSICRGYILVLVPEMNSYTCKWKYIFLSGDKDFNTKNHGTVPSGSTYTELFLQSCLTNFALMSRHQHVQLY